MKECYVLIDGRFEKRKVYLFFKDELDKFLLGINDVIIHNEMYINRIKLSQYYYYKSLKEYRLNGLSINDIELDKQLYKY